MQRKDIREVASIQGESCHQAPPGGIPSATDNANRCPAGNIRLLIKRVSKWLRYTLVPWSLNRICSELMSTINNTRRLFHQPGFVYLFCAVLISATVSSACQMHLCFFVLFLYINTAVPKMGATSISSPIKYYLQL